MKKFIMKSQRSEPQTTNRKLQTINSQPIFVTGIGTGIGKTLVSAIITEALQADYWKPIQAGYDNGTDSEWIKEVLDNNKSKIHTEAYKLKLAASPHIAAREEGLRIDLDVILNAYKKIKQKELIINNDAPTSDDQPSAILHCTSYILEGAGGLLVPLNEKEFVIDLIRKLNAKVILVSRNYLGSINHSLLTAAICKRENIDVIGWVFSDQYLSYEDEIVTWSGFPKICSIPYSEKTDKNFVSQQAQVIKSKLLELL